MFKTKIKIPAGIKSAFVFMLCSFITKGLAIITMPVFTRLMSTSQIGVINIYNSWYSLISSFSTLSLTSGGFAVAMNEYKNKRDEYESSVLSLTTLIALLISVIYIINPVFWQSKLGLSNLLIIMMLIGLVVCPAQEFWLYRQRYEYKYKLAGIVSIASSIFASLLSLLTVVKLKKGGSEYLAEGRLVSNNIVIYGVAFVIWLYIFIKGKTFYKKEYWVNSLKISLPLVGYSIASQILNVSDRIMIGHMVGNSAVGIYSTLYSVSSISLIIWQALNASFVPYLFENIGKNNNGIKDLANLIIDIYAFGSVIITYMAPEIVSILATKEYMGAVYIMPAIASGIFFTSLANLYSNIAIYYKKSQYVMYPAIVSALLNIVLNYIFIKKFGYLAAAYTTLASYIVLALLQILFSKKIANARGENINNIFDTNAFMRTSVMVTIISLIGIVLYNIKILRYMISTILLIILFKKSKGFLKKFVRIN